MGTEAPPKEENRSDRSFEPKAHRRPGLCIHRLFGSDQANLLIFYQSTLISGKFQLEFSLMAPMSDVPHITG